MSRADFDWYETELIKRYSIRAAGFLLLILCTLVVMALTGFFTTIVLILTLILGLIAAAVGFSLGLREIIKKDPSHVGLSSEMIRLRYYDGHHKDIPWNTVGGIKEERWSRLPEIVLKDGIAITVQFHKKIIAQIERKFQEIRISKEKVDPNEFDKSERILKAKKKRKMKDRVLPGEKATQKIKMQAKYQGTCLKCGVGIFPRQMIVKDGDGWIHERCADSETGKEIVLCTCGHSKGGHVKGVCMAGGCSCRGFKGEAVY
jgi:hypothetical protein